VKKILVLLLLAGGLLWVFRTPSVTAPGTDIAFEYIVERTGGAGWRDRLPLLIALHGNGDTPPNFFETALDGLTAPARVVCIRAPIAVGVGHAWPMDGEGVSRYLGPLADAIDVIAGRYPTIGRPLVFGFSGGAVMAYALAASYPRRYSLVVPVSGRLAGVAGDVPAEASGALARVVAFHGTRDTVIGIGSGRAACERLRALGLSVEFRERDGDHLMLFREVHAEINGLLNERLAWIRDDPTAGRDVPAGAGVAALL